MKSEIEGLSKIYSSALRGGEETATHTGFYTFNFKEYKSEGRESFGQLTFLNDESLAPLESITYTHEEDRRVILLPIVGALSYHNSHKEDFVKSDQIKILDIKKGLPYTVNNPFEKEWINYLHIGYKINASTLQHPFMQNIEFKMDELVSLNFEKQIKDQTPGYIGIYKERSEGRYTLKNPDNGIFVYVIRGAFDTHGRLLELRDGLSFWNTQEIEFEALSNNATIMIFEIKLK